MKITYVKLRSGDWGVRIEGKCNRTGMAGKEVMVVTKAGKEKTETLAALIWQGKDVMLWAIEGNQRRSRSNDGWCYSCNMEADSCHCG